jgi:hypothetical protein
MQHSGAKTETTRRTNLTNYLYQDLKKDNFNIGKLAIEKLCLLSVPI